MDGIGGVVEIGMERLVLIHGWVRRRKWIRELHRKQVSPRSTEVDQKLEVATEEEQAGKRGGGGFDGLLSVFKGGESS